MSLDDADGTGTGMLEGRGPVEELVAVGHRCQPFAGLRGDILTSPGYQRDRGDR
jgi:hypothetical protein